jgi:hypothetical protein
LKRSGTGLIFVISTDRHITTVISDLNITITTHTELDDVTAISNRNTTFPTHLKFDDIDQEMFENGGLPNNSLCQVHIKHPKEHRTCSVDTLEKNYFHEEAITVMVVQTLVKLQWKSFVIFYENSTGTVKDFFFHEIYMMYDTILQSIYHN